MKQSQSTAPYQAHSQTSKAAAIDIGVVRTKLQVKVLTYIASRPDGAIDEECQLDLRMNPSTQRPRRIELQELGFVVDSGLKRPTSSGRLAIVWKAVLPA
jgi:hypothetical protein